MFSKDTLVVGVMAEVSLAGKRNINRFKTSERATVPHMNSHDGGPDQLQADEQFTKRAIEQTE
jgi:hypothetical protein